MLSLHIFSVGACLLSAASFSLRDNAVVGDVMLLLDGPSWSVSNGSLVVPASIPGDLITDLQLGGVVGDPLYEMNYEGVVWDTGNWTYSITFTVPASFTGSAAQTLV